MSSDGTITAWTDAPRRYLDGMASRPTPPRREGQLVLPSHPLVPHC